MKLKIEEYNGKKWIHIPVDIKNYLGERIKIGDFDNLDCCEIVVELDTIKELIQLVKEN